MSVIRRKNGIYDYDFWRRGLRFCGSTGSRSEREARRVERLKIEEAERNIARYQAQKSGPISVDVAFDRFWAEVGDSYHGSYRATVFKALADLLADLGKDTLLRDIGPNAITEIIAKRRGASLKAATINRTVTEVLRRIWLRASRKWEQQLPTIDWKDLMLPEPKERIRELRDHEETTLFEHMRPDYRPVLRFALASGLRLKEVVGLRWANIDWTARTVSVVGKGDKPATIPLTSEMRAIIVPLKGQHPEAIFTYVSRDTRPNHRRGAGLVRGKRYPITYEGLKTVWRRHGGPAAGLEDFRFHDIRHTAATRLLRTSGNLRLVQRLLRHEDIATTTKYAHADDEDLRCAMEAVTESRRKSRRSRTKPG